MKETKPQIYFQTQRGLSNDCGVCALNNMLGSQVFSANNLINICKELSQDFINPYKSILGGDFDVTVLIVALKKIGLAVSFIKPTEQIQPIMQKPTFFGFLINRVSCNNKYLCKIFFQSGRHWTCLRKQGDQYFYLDSQEPQPQKLADKDSAQNLIHLIRQTGGIILSVELQPEAQKRE